MIEFVNKQRRSRGSYLQRQEKEKFASNWNAIYHSVGCSVVLVTCSSFYVLSIYLCICIFVYFREYLFLFVISQISSALTQGRHIRKLAIRVLRNMLVKHELDDRYEGEVSSNWDKHALLTSEQNLRFIFAVMWRTTLSIVVSLVTIQTMFLKTCSWEVINGWFSNRTGTSVERAERTKHDFRCPICRSATGQASCSICARGRQLKFPLCCWISVFFFYFVMCWI